MTWFGSSAGVALAKLYPEAKSVGRWITQGWPIAVAYFVGFFVMLAILAGVRAPLNEKRAPRTGAIGGLAGRRRE